METKKLSSVRTRFHDCTDMFQKKSPPRASWRHAVVSMSRVYHSVKLFRDNLGGGGERPQF